MNLQYGKINHNIDKWEWPTLNIFQNWLDDFFSIPCAEKFEVYVIGRFVDVMFGEQIQTPDIDIILNGNHNLEEIDEVLNKGTRLGIEKYSTFFDIVWKDCLPIYSKMKHRERILANIYIVGNQWIEDGVVKKNYPSEKISDSLWKYVTVYPTIKQMERIEQGYVYKEPLKIEKIR